MAQAGRYLYGLVQTDEDLDWGAIGIESDGKPSRVFTVRAGGIAAVVSERSARDKVLPLRKNLLPHNGVIREVMKTRTIVPIAFGHVARNDKELQRMLTLNREKVVRELARLDHKVEMGLKLRIDGTTVFQHVVSTDADLARYRDEVFGSPGGPSQTEKIELGRMFEEQLNSLRDGLAERLVENLTGSIAESKINPPKGEAILVDLLLLVEQDKIPALESRVSQIADGYPEQYAFDYTGPWAPFNFVELDLELARA